jgi:hypothetical protein
VADVSVFHPSPELDIDGREPAVARQLPGNEFEPAAGPVLGDDIGVQAPRGQRDDSAPGVWESSDVGDIHLIAHQHKIGVLRRLRPVLRTELSDIGMGQDVVLKDEEIGKTLLDDPHPEAEHGHRASDLTWPEARVEKPPVTFANGARITGEAVQAFLEDDVSEPHFAQLG